MVKKMLKKILLLCCLMGLTLPALAEDTLLYEMRTYTTNDGKLQALQSGLREHTMGIFEKHGMPNISYWIPADLPNTLIYVIAHKNADVVKGNWEAFVADPAWREVYAASIADGQLVKNIENVFMTKTDYSP